MLPPNPARACRRGARGFSVFSGKIEGCLPPPLPNTTRFPANGGTDTTSFRWYRRFMQARRRVLIVDDEPAIARLLSAAFECAGYEVRVATSGPEAIAICLEVGSFDAV